MEDILQKFAEIVIDVTRNEDITLRRVGKGVFQVPELAFSYAVGRRIAIEADKIFGSHRVTWLPEKFIKSTAGRTDLVFHVESCKGLAIEFKIGGGWPSYRDDILKLAAVDSTLFHRVFCGLIDTWPYMLYEDPRIKKVEEALGPKISRISKNGVGASEPFDFFATLHTDYKNQICCMVCLWYLSETFQK